VLGKVSTVASLAFIAFELSADGRRTNGTFSLEPTHSLKALVAQLGDFLQQKYEDFKGTHSDKHQKIGKGKER
jgi:hypothetical protein